MMNKIDDESQSIIRNIALQNWATVANACLRHDLLAPEFKDAFLETHGKLQTCQTLQSDMPITAETMQTNDL